MRLKYQLLLLGLLSLLFPITAWLGLKSVDKEFRLNIEQAAHNTLLSMTAAVQEIFHNNAIELDGFVPIMLDEWIVDGADSEWQQAKAYHYNKATENLSVKIAHDSNNVSLFIQTNDTSHNSNSLNASQNDQIIIALADDRGLYKYHFPRQAEGFLYKDNDNGSKPEFHGYWHEQSQGYSLEIRFIGSDIHHLGVASINKSVDTSISTGTLDTAATLKLLPIITVPKIAQQAIDNITPINNQFILKDAHQRIIYQSNKLPSNANVSNWQWLITPIYQWLFAIDASDKNNRWFYRQEDGMAGVKQQISTDNVLFELTSLLPQGQQNMIQSLLKAGILMLLVVVLLMLAYLSYALFLAWRIKKLNRALQSVLDSSGQLNIHMPSHAAADEIGQLSRAIVSMLRELREYTQYLKDLGSRLSHEMKTPLAIVQSSLDNLAQEPNPEFLQRAQDGTARLRFILNQLSQLSQLKHTLEQTPKQPLDIVKLMQQLTQSYQSYLPNIKTQFDTSSFMIDGSAELLAQLMDKLMDNAQDFIAQDGHIEISLMAHKDTLKLEFFNTDSQLPDNGLNIFDSLVSVRNKKASTDNTHIHLGLGLYLVQLICRFHKAKITAANATQAKGVVFTIEFKASATI